MTSCTFSLRSLSVAACAVLIIAFTACKKSGGGSGSTNTSGFYLTATVNGKSWAANIANDTLNSPVLAAPDNSLILLLGIQAAGKDSSAIALVFPENITLNKTVAFNAAQSTEAVYVLGTVGYNTVSPNANTDDSLTVTSFDQTNMIMEGNFKGTFYSTTSSQTLKITNGKFRTPVLKSTSQLPPSNVKF